MASERELNLLIKARDHATKVINQNRRALQSLEKNVDSVTKATEMMGDSSNNLRRYSSETYEMMKMQKKASQEMKKHWQELSDSTDKYGGSTTKLMADIDSLGKKHKKVMDEMINNNSRYRASFYRGIGVMQAASTWSDETAKNIKRNYGPLRALDLGFLRLNNRMENLAKSGNAARVALEELGPTAKMKDLLSLMRHINRSAAGIQMLQLGAGIVTIAEIALLVMLSNAVDGRLIPAFEKFKEVWLDALTPFAHMITDIFLAVLNFGTAIGQVMAEFAAAHPLLSKMVWGFLALIPPLTLLLAPLALGLSLWRNYRVMFAKLFTMIRPVVTAFMSIIGTVLLVAAAIVAGIAAWNQMITHSEKLREAVTTLKDAFVGMWSGFMAIIGPALQQLKTSFMNLIQTLTGASTVGDFWQSMGDKMATIFNWISTNVVPILSAALQVLGEILSQVFTAAAGVLDKFAAWWVANQPMITEKVNLVKQILFTAFQAVASFLMSIMPQIQATVGSAFEFIKAAAQFLAPIIGAVFSFIKSAMTVLWPIVVSVIQGAWNNIKAVVTSAIAIIQNIFQLFTNILQGNWSAAWQNVKNILTNAVTLIWNAIQLYFLGRMMGALRSFGTGALNLIKGAWTGIQNAFKSSLTFVSNLVQTVMGSVRVFLNGVMGLIKTLFQTYLNAVKATWTAVLNGLKTVAFSIFTAIRTTIQTALTAIRTVISSVINGVKSSWSAGLNFLKSLATGVWQAIVNGVRNMGSNMKSAFTSMISGIKSAWSSFKSTALGMGKDLVRGLISGITSMAGEALQAAKNVVKNALDAAKSFLKIKSPSRVMIEVGAFFSEGFAGGITKAAKLAKKASTKMTKDAVKPVEKTRIPQPKLDDPYGSGSGGGGGAAAAGGGTTIQVNIQQVNLPNVKNGEEFVQQVGGFTLQQAFRNT